MKILKSAFGGTEQPVSSPADGTGLTDAEKEIIRSHIEPAFAEIVYERLGISVFGYIPPEQQNTAKLLISP